MDNKTMAYEMKEHLIECIIPFWRGLKDRENGGYYGEMSYGLLPDKRAVKGGILNSRLLWFFSNAYMIFKDESLLDEASHAYKFLKERLYDKQYGGVYWSVNYDGGVRDDTKDSYNQAFAIYGLASYCRAAKDSEAGRLAISIFNLLNEKCCKRLGCIEAYDREYQNTVPSRLSERGLNAKNTMNTLLHLLEAVTELYQVTGYAEAKDSLHKLLDLFAEKIFNPNENRLEVFFDANMSTLIDAHSYGHDIEAAWLLDRGCEVLEDEGCTRKISVITSAITRKIYERAFKDNSILYECVNGEDNAMRSWWAQAEAVVGFLNGYQKNTAYKEYRHASESIWGYIKNNLIDRRRGSEWLSGIDQHGEPLKAPIASFWKCPYHNGRMCMEVIIREPHV